MVINDDVDLPKSTGPIRFTSDGAIDMGGLTCSQFYNHLLKSSGTKPPKMKFPESGPEWPKNVSVWLEEPNIVFDIGVWCTALSILVEEAKCGLSRKVYILEHSCDWDFDKQEWGRWCAETNVAFDDESLKRFFAWYKEQEET